MEERGLGTAVLNLARLTNAQWLAVSLFEDVIDLPGRIAEQPAGTAFGHGSPARYHVPAAVPTIGSAIGPLSSRATNSGGAPSVWPLLARSSRQG